jgi:transposase
VRRTDIERERDVEQLRRIALVQHSALEALTRKLAARDGDDAAQQALALLTATTPAKKPASNDAPEQRKQRKERKEFGPTEQKSLRHVERVYVLDEADRACPSCGGELRPMEDQFEESEMIDVVDVEYQVVLVKRQKYRCRCGGCVDTALGPDRVTPGGRYSAEFGVKVATDKYLDHVPLSRQERILARHGLQVTTQTLWDQLHELAKQLKLVDDALLAHLLKQPVIGLDQTGWPKLETNSQKPWQMWCLTAPGVVVHRIRDDKSAATFKDLVGNYTGTIVCDALATHAAGARDGPGIALGGCWAHVLRKFREAEPDHPDAASALRWIGELYEIDREAGDDIAKRAELRRTRSREMLGALHAWLMSQVTLKSLSIGHAAAYTLANWNKLTRFVEDARIPLDNNATERALRGPVVGRKNHYGSKSRRGTEVAATFYSLLETAKLHDVNPSAYLVAAVRAARDGRALMPWESADASDENATKTDAGR